MQAGHLHVGGVHHGDKGHHNNWGWHANRRGEWGIADIATGEIITSAIVNSRALNPPTIAVQATNRNLNYNFEQSSPQPMNIDFTYYINEVRVNDQANCRQGLINVNQPANAPDVHALNIVCLCYATKNSKQ